MSSLAFLATYGLPVPAFNSVKSFVKFFVEEIYDQCQLYEFLAAFDSMNDKEFHEENAVKIAKFFEGDLKPWQLSGLLTFYDLTRKCDLEVHPNCIFSSLPVEHGLENGWFILSEKQVWINSYAKCTSITNVIAA